MNNWWFSIQHSTSLFGVRCWIFILCTACNAQVSITDGAISEGQECYKIETYSATYLYQKEAGGFSNIYDSEGTDWIQFHKSPEATYPASAAADYRGLPNLVFRSDDGGAGHPGFDKMTSEKVSENQIRSISKSGNWQWTWTFNPEFAELQVEKIDSSHAYWFLYEGPIAGKFSPASHYWGTDLAGPLTEQPDLVRGPEKYAHWQTVYFGDAGYHQTFFVHQMQPDTLRDLYTYMGHTKSGNDSSDGMVVFGFGRAPRATPLMKSPHKFRIGFYPQRVESEIEHKAILEYINELN